MSILTEALPSGILIDGRKYEVHTSFRNWIEIYRLLFEEKLTAEGCARAIALCYKELPPDPRTAYAGIFEFLHPQKTVKKDKKDKNDSANAYSFEYDAEYIFADFRRFYGIDLQTCDMHWYSFYALFKGLPDESRIKDIIYIRTVKLSKIKDKAERARLRKLKELYALPDVRTPEERDNDFAAALW